MQLTPQMEKAVPGPIVAASSQFSNLSDRQAGEPHYSGDAARLQALRLQLARFGLSVSTTSGDGLLLSGLGSSQLAPDMRSAWILARHLNGGRFA